MYKPVEPIRCPDCGEVVKVNTDIVFTSYPPQYHWVCPKCGKTGYTCCDSVALENKVFIEATTPPPKTRSCDIPAPKFIQQGWECPRCGAILAPYMQYCPICSEKESDWITTVGTGTQPFYGEWTNRDNLTPPTGQYTNPNPSTTISLGVKPKKSDSTCVYVPTNNRNDIKLTI